MSDGSGSAADVHEAMGWREHIQRMRRDFPSPWREEQADDAFENTFLRAVKWLDQMKPPRHFEGQEAWKGYLGTPALPDYSRCHDARLAEGMTPLDEVLRGLVGLFDGMPNWNHPQTMANVIPPANTASIMGATLGAVFSPNVVEGEYSWNVARAEIESGAMLADLIGWDPKTAGGLYTSGGSGCYLYGLKYALTHVLGRESRDRGIREDAQVLVSAAGHFSKASSTDWTGLGMDNLRLVEVDADNRMSVAHLRQVLRECHDEGKPVAMVVCTMGTTDAFAVDPIAEVRALLDEYQNAKGYPRPLLYADAVIGWAYTAFNAYDFRANPLRFSPAALKAIRHNQQLIEPIAHADAVGIDLHKTGWSPYCCSYFLVRDHARMVSLLARPMPAYLQDRTPYNPFKFTLECSRPGSTALAGWATLRLFGRMGFQVMLGRLIEVGLSLRALLAQEKHFVCVNADNHGFVTLFRVYPRHVDAKRQYERELTDPRARAELHAYNQLQTRVANKLFAMLRDPEHRVVGWENPPYTSFTSGFRPTDYRLPDQNEDDLIAALKAYPMSPNSNELSMLIIRSYASKALDLAVEEMLAEADPAAPGERPSVYDWFGERRRVPKEFLVAGEASGDGVEALRRVPLCAHFDDAQCDALLAGSGVVTMAPGEVVFSEGDRADKVYVVVSGKVLVYRASRAGDVAIATVTEGNFFGEMALFDGGLRGASVRCLEPCEFLVIDGERFLHQLLG